MRPHFSVLMASSAVLLLLVPSASAQKPKPNQLADNQPAMPGMEGAGETVDCKGETPCGCAMLGDVGLTTVSGTTATGTTLPVGENIYGPFENGFGSQQENILAELGCASGKGYVSGGIDTKTAEAVVAKDCGVILPRTDAATNTYVSLLDQCGGHTTAYHFHERLSCLYKLEGTHSTKVGEDVQFKKGIYGKWEDYSTKTLPALDACGGHFGYTPESPTTKVYHYHMQDEAPFTLGCFGPNKDNQEVSVAECRALYDGCNTKANLIDVVTYNGTAQYQTWCPCYFSNNKSNVIVGQEYTAETTSTTTTIAAGSGTTTTAAGSGATTIAAGSGTTTTAAGSGSASGAWTWSLQVLSTAALLSTVAMLL